MFWFTEIILRGGEKPLVKGDRLRWDRDTPHSARIVEALAIDHRFHPPRQFVRCEGDEAIDFLGGGARR